MTPGARLQAVIDILDEMERTVKPVERHLREWGRTHRFAGSKDRAAIAARLYAIERRRAQLAWRMQSASPRALAIAAVLDEGEVETLFSGTGYGPAALSDAERACIASPQAGEMPAHVKGEYPEFLEDELRRAFAERLPEEMLALQQRAPVDLRVNTLKTHRDAVIAALAAQGYDAQATLRSPLGIRLPAGVAGLERTALFESGAFEFQDEAAQVASLMCEAAPGMRVLDLAAGAGGKSLALAAAMQNEGEIVACDIRTDALAELERRAVRAGVRIIRTTENLPRPCEAGERAGVRGLLQQAQPSTPPHPDPLPHMRGGEGIDGFDIVLVDAPCSGTGTWRRQPELRWRLTPERLIELQAIQDSLLAQAATYVKPGGRLVYATCSILPCENEDRIARLRESHPQFAPAGDEFRASPLSTGTDGFFAAVLTSGQAPPDPRP
jgi:16S rRNA (cytosine967-C5)-methyltransferase